MRITVYIIASYSYTLNIHCETHFMCTVSDVTVVTSFRNVPGSKWRLLSNVLARGGETGETAANWNNSRPWIGLFQGVKCDNVPKRGLEFA